MSAFRSIAQWCGTLVLSLASTSAPTTKGVEPATPVFRDYSDVECVCRVLRLAGHPVDPLSIAPGGANAATRPLSSDDLQRILSDRGVPATVVKDLSIQDLAATNGPVILRVQANQYSVQPDHYIVYAGMKDNEARVLNLPHPEVLIPYVLLASRWHGEAIAVSASRHPSYDCQRITWYSVAATLGAIGAIGAPLCRKRWPTTIFHGTSMRAVGVVGIALLMTGGAFGMIWQLVGPSHYISRTFVPIPSDAAVLVDFAARLDATVEAPFPKIDERTAERLLSEGVLFVDARSESEFAAGHIKGAAHAPAGNVGQIRLNMAGIRKDRRIAVYCAVSHCGKAEYAAGVLRQQGFTDISVYTGGWAEWKGPKSK